MQVTTQQWNSVSEHYISDIQQLTGVVYVRL